MRSVDALVGKVHEYGKVAELHQENAHAAELRYGELQKKHDLNTKQVLKDKKTWQSAKTEIELKVRPCTFPKSVNTAFADWPCVHCFTSNAGDCGGPITGDCLSIHRPIHAQHNTDTFRSQSQAKRALDDFVMEKKAREREVVSLREQVRAVESQRAWQSSETAERDRFMSELRERAAASELKASELELRLQQVSLETKAIAAQRDVLDKRVRRNDELATGKNFELEQLRKRLAAAERGLSVSQNEVTALKSEKGKGALKPPLPVPNVPNKQEVRPWGFPKSRPPCVPILVLRRDGYYLCRLSRVITHTHHERLTLSFLHRRNCFARRKSGHKPPRKTRCSWRWRTRHRGRSGWRPSCL
jgi:hypothetical protein